MPRIAAAASSAVVPLGDRRLQPPDHLPDAARRCFARLVASLPANHFRHGDLDLLCRYAEAVATAEEAAFHISQPGGMVTGDGKVSPWWRIHQDAGKAISGLALRLRIGPQSRMAKASSKEGPPPSYYDLMRADPNWGKPT
jgi:phage terminase small subunit